MIYNGLGSWWKCMDLNHLFACNNFVCEFLVPENIETFGRNSSIPICDNSFTRFYYIFHLRNLQKDISQFFQCLTIHELLKGSSLPHTVQLWSSITITYCMYNWYDVACFLSKNTSSFANVPNLWLHCLFVMIWSRRLIAWIHIRNSTIIESTSQCLLPGLW